MLAISRDTFVTVMGGEGFAMCWLLTSVTRRGHVFGAIAVTLAAGPLVVLCIWAGMQQMQPRVFTWQSISYAALVGDGLGLTALFGLAAAGYARAGSQLEGSNWATWWARLLCYVFGLAGGIAFHLRGGPADSQSPDLGVRMHDCPNSWGHNIGVMPGLLGAAAGVLLPLLFSTSGASRHFGAAALVVGLIVWGGAFAFDALRPGFDPHWLDVDTAGRWPWVLLPSSTH